jgi:uncharacterized membrane protein
MPYRITADRTGASEKSGALSTSSAPSLILSLTPHQSLTPKGFVVFIGVTATAFALPLLSLAGTPAFWWVLPPVALTVLLIWTLLKRSWRDGTLREDVTLWPDRLLIERANPRAPDQIWEANPHWVRVTLHATSGPVDNYLTLAGNAGREVELGRFLTPQERAELHRLLTRALAAVKLPLQPI